MANMLKEAEEAERAVQAAEAKLRQLKSENAALREVEAEKALLEGQMRALQAQWPELEAELVEARAAKQRLREQQEQVAAMERLLAEAAAAREAELAALERERAGRAAERAAHAAALEGERRAAREREAALAEAAAARAAAAAAARAAGPPSPAAEAAAMMQEELRGWAVEARLRAEADLRRNADLQSEAHRAEAARLAGHAKELEAKLAAAHRERELLEGEQLPAIAAEVARLQAEAEAARAAAAAARGAEARQARLAREAEKLRALLAEVEAQNQGLVKALEVKDKHAVSPLQQLEEKATLETKEELERLRRQVRDLETRLEFSESSAQEQGGRAAWERERPRRSPPGFSDDENDSETSSSHSPKLLPGRASNGRGGAVAAAAAVLSAGGIPRPGGGPPACDSQDFGTTTAESESERSVGGRRSNQSNPARRSLASAAAEVLTGGARTPRWGSEAGAAAEGRGSGGRGRGRGLPPQMEASREPSEVYPSGGDNSVSMSEYSDYEAGGIFGRMNLLAVAEEVNKRRNKGLREALKKRTGTPTRFGSRARAEAAARKKEAAARARAEAGAAAGGLAFSEADKVESDGAVRLEKARSQRRLAGGGRQPSTSLAVNPEDEVYSVAFDTERKLGENELEACIDYVFKKEMDIGNNKLQKVVMYRVHVMTAKKHWTVERRYKDFRWLHSQLMENIGGKGMPEMPGPHMTALTKSSHLIQRRSALEVYLLNLLALKANWVCYDENSDGISALYATNHHDRMKESLARQSLLLFLDSSQPGVEGEDDGLGAFFSKY